MLLRCPKCSREMRVLALIDDREVIGCILRHLGFWQEGVRVYSGAYPPSQMIIKLGHSLPSPPDGGGTTPSRTTTPNHSCTRTAEPSRQATVCFLSSLQDTNTPPQTGSNRRVPELPEKRFPIRGCNLVEAEVGQRVLGIPGFGGLKSRYEHEGCDHERQKEINNPMPTLAVRTV